MSPGSAMALLSLPPVRGAAALLFLVLVGSVPFMDDSDLGILARLGLGGALVTLGTPIWVMTLQGFWRGVARWGGRGDRGGAPWGVGEAWGARWLRQSASVAAAPLGSEVRSERGSRRRG